LIIKIEYFMNFSVNCFIFRDDFYHSIQLFIDILFLMNLFSLLKLLFYVMLIILFMKDVIILCLFIEHDVNMLDGEVLMNV